MTDVLLGCFLTIVDWNWIQIGEPVIASPCEVPAEHPANIAWDRFVWRNKALVVIAQLHHL